MTISDDRVYMTWAEFKILGVQHKLLFNDENKNYYMLKPFIRADGVPDTQQLLICIRS